MLGDRQPPHDQWRRLQLDEMAPLSSQKTKPNTTNFLETYFENFF